MALRFFFSDSSRARPSISETMRLTTSLYVITRTRHNDRVGATWETHHSSERASYVSSPPRSYLVRHGRNHQRQLLQKEVDHGLVLVARHGERLQQLQLVLQCKRPFSPTSSENTVKFSPNLSSKSRRRAVGFSRIFARFISTSLMKSGLTAAGFFWHHADTPSDSVMGRRKEWSRRKYGCTEESWRRVSSSLLLCT